MSVRAVIMTCHYLAFADIDANDTSQYDVDFDWLDEQRRYYQIVVPVFIALCWLAALANGSILLLVRWTRKPLFPVLKLTLGLAMADSWASLVTGTQFFLTSYLPIAQGIIVAKVACVVLAFEVLRMGSLFTSVFHLLMLAVNHFYAIANPAMLKTVLSDNMVCVGMLAAWLLPPLFFCLGFSIVPNAGFQSENCSLNFLRTLRFRCFVVVPLLVPVLFMSALYYRMSSILSRAEQRFERQHRRSAVIRRKRRTMTTTLLILGSFLIAWVPNCVAYLLTNYTYPVCLNQRQVLWMNMVTNLLMILKFLINPMLYAARIPELRDALGRAHRSWSSRGQMRELGQLMRRAMQEQARRLTLQPRAPVIASFRRMSFARNRFLSATPSSTTYASTTTRTSVSSTAYGCVDISPNNYFNHSKYLTVDRAMRYGELSSYVEHEESMNLN